jgi:hypothetical protein
VFGGADAVRVVVGGGLMGWLVFLGLFALSVFCLWGTTGGGDDYDG